MTRKNKIELCPCGLDIEFSKCCQLYITGNKQATTAEQLMRSRYCAYVKKEEAYLLSSWHPSTRPEKLDLEESEPDKWLGLKIVSKYAGKETDNDGEIEFVARFKTNGKAHRLHEKSRFLKENGQWFYLDGDMQE